MYVLFFKRIIDLIIGISILPLFIIIYFIIALLIKLEDGGTVLYSGERLGKNLKKYKMYKFRSMTENAPDIRNIDGSTFNSENDIRLTRVGRVIRKVSIDEIPQILNVIKGDMSLIGPRPSPCGNIHLYTEEYLLKFHVKPGITGYTQAYCRNSAQIEEKQIKDIYYINNISFILDLKILFKTIFTVIKREGIYSIQNKDNKQTLL